MRRICAVAAWLLACSPDPDVVTARLSWAELPSCRLPAIERLVVRASGDFPSVQQEIDAVERRTIEAFPVGTHWLAIETDEGERGAGSLIALDGGDQQARALLLPYGASCPLGDPRVAALPGSAFAPLPGGGLLIAGGAPEGGAALATAAVLAPGAALAAEVEGGMLIRRGFATATQSGGSVVVAGGAADMRGAAHDTFEIYDVEGARFDTSQIANLSGPRRDHAAVRLPDGQVLLAGGVPEIAAPPLDDAELIEVGAGDATPLPRALRRARTAPALLVLDSGAVLLALGLDADERPVMEVERFDVERGRFEVVSELPAYPHAAVAALEGDRVAYVGCPDADAAAADQARCALWWLLPDGEAGFDAVASTLDGEALASVGLRGLRDLRAAALGDGRLLVTGRDRGAPVERRAFVIDPNEPAIAVADATRVPERLLALDDGTFVEADAIGASLRREDVRSELDAAPDGLVDARAPRVALDLAEHWRRGGAELVAAQAARFDVPRLRFAAVRIELALDGGAELLLEPEHAPAIAVALDAERVHLDDCSIARAADGPVVVERRGESVVLRSAGATAECRAARARSGRIGIALRAKEGARIRELRIVRL